MFKLTLLEMFVVCVYLTGDVCYVTVLTLLVMSVGCIDLTGDICCLSMLTFLPLHIYARADNPSLLPS